MPSLSKSDISDSSIWTIDQGGGRVDNQGMNERKGVTTMTSILNREVTLDSFASLITELFG